MENEFAKWLLKLDRSLQINSELADQFRHNATAGSVREFLIAELFKKFLPEIVQFGKGKVIDSTGKMSKQIDLILFDSRFPSLRIESGEGLYPIEGVLATVEAKTTIGSTDDLNLALSNCESVMHLVQSAERGVHESMIERMRTMVKVEQCSPLDAYVKVGYLAVTPTYIFAITDGLTGETICHGVDEWFHRKKHVEEKLPIMPRAIVSGHSVGVLYDGLNRLLPPDDAVDHARKLFGPNGRVLMSIFNKVQHRLSWFATHMLFAVCSRIGLANSATGGYLSIEKYLPLEECFADESITDQPGNHVLWNGRFPEFKQRTC